MNIIIIFIFFVVLVLAYKLAKDISHPGLIWVFVWFLFSSLHELVYQLEIIEINQLSNYTLFFFMAGAFFFFFGSYILTATGIKRNVIRKNKNKKIHGVLNVFIHLAPLLFIPLYISKANILSASSGIAHLTDNWLMSLRYAMNTDELSMGAYAYIVPLAFFNFFIRVIGYGGRKDYWLALLIAVTYAILSTGRTFFLLIVIVIIADLLIQKKIFKVAQLIIVFFGFFILIGSILLKFNVNGASYLDGVLVYMLGGMSAFDYISSEYMVFSIKGVDNIMRTPIAILHSLGALDTPPIKLIRDFVYVPFGTNVYTVYDPYIKDLGFPSSTLHP